MSFVAQKGMENKKTAVAGVVIIHAAMGAVLVTGLAPALIDIVAPPPPPTTFDVKDKKPPPPPEPTPEVKEAKPQSPPIYTPPTRVDINDFTPDITLTSDLPDITDLVIKDVVPVGDTYIAPVPKPTPTPPPGLKPVAARPSNNTGSWVTNNDYRPSWVRREMEGSGRFTLSVGTNGRVQDCRVASSTGHSALDTATCKLMKQRARFDAARGTQGEKVSGSFTTSIRWELPD